MVSMDMRTKMAKELLIVSMMMQRNKMSMDSVQLIKMVYGEFLNQMELYLLNQAET